MAIWKVWIDKKEIIYGVLNEAVVRAESEEEAKDLLVDSWNDEPIQEGFPRDKIYTLILSPRGAPGILSGTEQA